MSFFKSLVLAIIATLVLTYALGISVLEIFDVDMYMGDELVEPLAAISVSALVAVLLVVVSLAIVLSVFGTVIFAVMLVIGGLALVTIGAFWPIILIAGIIYLMTKEKKQPETTY